MIDYDPVAVAERYFTTIAPCGSCGEEHEEESMVYDADLGVFFCNEACEADYWLSEARR